MQVVVLRKVVNQGFSKLCTSPLTPSADSWYTTALAGRELREVARDPASSPTNYVHGSIRCPSGGRSSL